MKYVFIVNPSVTSGPPTFDMPHSQDTTNTYLDLCNWQVCSYFLINLLFKEMFLKCCEVMSDQVLALNLFIFFITLKVNVNVLPKTQRTLCNILWWHLLAWTFSLPLSLYHPEFQVVGNLQAYQAYYFLKATYILLFIHIPRMWMADSSLHLASYSNTNVQLTFS